MGEEKVGGFKRDKWLSLPVTSCYTFRFHRLGFSDGIYCITECMFAAPAMPRRDMYQDMSDKPTLEHGQGLVR